MLTPRQKEIVTGIVDGKSYKMIANDLFVSLDTVRSHIKNIYKALEINSKAELIKKSYDNEIWHYTNRPILILNTPKVPSRGQLSKLSSKDCPLEGTLGVFLIN